jgi:hypothetical protein
MRDCDAILTIIPLSSEQSRGTETGLEEGKRLNKPMYTARRIDDVPDILRWLNDLPDGIELCIGGPRASECPEAYSLTKAILDRITESK